MLPPGVIFELNTLSTIGIADGLMQRLQVRTVQNAAARLITGARRRVGRDHISPVLRQLHWLPVRQRV